MLKKDIIIRVGGVYVSVLEHCRKKKFRTFEVEIQYVNSSDRITQSFNIAMLE